MQLIQEPFIILNKEIGKTIYITNFCLYFKAALSKSFLTVEKQYNLLNIEKPTLSADLSSFG
jgi:hypothetical protein